MGLGLLLYRALTFSAAPLLPAFIYHRTRNGKEIRERSNERFARALPERPAGQLVWIHGASLGECKLALSLITALQARRPDLNFLITSQTVSAARMITSNLPPQTRHQIAPIDTQASANRFLNHWQPDLFVLTESELWPNLLSGVHSRKCASALVNARMTNSSRKRWQKFPASARMLLANFDYIHATDDATAQLLSELTGRNLAEALNLKVGAMAQADLETASPSHLDTLKDGETCGIILLGASTHPGEDELLIEAFKTLPKGSQLILAPRHIDRAEAIARALKAANLSYSLRSEGALLSAQTPVLIADTFGEMDLWYARANTIYLGGGHTKGVGGHNPLEPLKFRKPVLTGPETGNFAALFKTLQQTGWVETVHTAGDICRAIQSPSRVEPRLLDSLIESGRAQFEDTILALSSLLNEPAS